MILQLSYSGHYPDVFVEATQEDLDRIDKIENEGNYLFDTEEGRALLEEFKARPRVKVETVTAYI